MSISSGGKILASDMTPSKLGAIPYNTSRTEIPASSDLNDYLTPGCYKCSANANASTLSNCPSANAFYLDILPTTGSSNTINPSGHTYVVQRLYSLDKNDYKRYISTNATDAITYSKWYQIATLDDINNAIANSGPEIQAWNISKSETNNGETTYVYFNTADSTIKQFEIYFSDTPTYKYSSSSDYYDGNWVAGNSVKLAADGGSTLIFDNRGAKYFKTSGGRLYLQFGDDDLGGCTLKMNLIVYIYR